MLLHKNFKKILILFFIFYCSSGSVSSSGDKHHHRNISLFNKNICKDGGSGSGASGGCIVSGAASIINIVSYKRTPVYYVSRNKDARQYPNQYRVFARGILRKYICIVNVVIIYIILYSL